MSNASDDQKLFKLILSAIASETLGPEDYEVALSSLRNGQMIAIIEQILVALANVKSVSTSPKSTSQTRSSEQPKRSSQRSGSKIDTAKSADQLFDDVKRRKITRDRLEAILNSLDSGFLSTVDSSETMRNIIREFEQRTNQRQWQLFDSIVNGNYESDPYLDSISDGR